MDINYTLNDKSAIEAFERAKPLSGIKNIVQEAERECGDCLAWSGTDCTRNPYTDGCLKDK